MDAAGLLSDTSSFDSAEVAQKLESFSPNLALVRAEVGAPQLLVLTKELQRLGRPLPMVLLCQDMRDAQYTRHLRTGIVELLQLPFSARLHVARLRQVPLELPVRRGQIKGQGAHRDLSMLIGHLVRTQREGQLFLNKGTPEEGQLTFVKGVLKKTRLGELTGEAALNRIKSLQKAQWLFEEGTTSDAVSQLELGADESMELERGPSPAPMPAAAPEPLPSAEAESIRPTLDIDFKLPPPPPPPQLPGIPQDGPIDFFGGSLDAVPAPSASAPSAPAAPAVTGDEAQTPLLFIDDDPTLVQMFSTYFTKKGYPTVTASDGVDGYQKMLTGRFEMVIVDLNMPRLDGWGFLRVAREDFRTVEIPIAVFSNHDNYREQLRALHAGAQAYYSKSLKMQALEAQVRELLEPRRRFVRLVTSGQSVVMALGGLGMQWVLRKLAELKVSGQLDAQDAWATYRLQLAQGQLVHVGAKSGAQTLNPERALMTLLASRNVEGSILKQPDQAPPPGASTETVLTRVVALMNEEQLKLKEEQLKQARDLDVNTDLYQLYLQVGPPAWKPAVQLLCEAKLLPRDVMSRLSMSANELSAVLKDLVRRGVVVLKS